MFAEDFLVRLANAVDRGDYHLDANDSGRLSIETCGLDLSFSGGEVDILRNQLSLLDKVHSMLDSEEYAHYYKQVLPSWKTFWNTDNYRAAGRQMLYRNEDIAHPCMTSIHLMVRESELFVFAHMRSCDLYKKLLADIFILDDFAKYCSETYKYGNITQWTIHIHIDSAHVFPEIESSDIWECLECVKMSSQCVRRKVAACVRIGGQSYFGYNQTGARCNNQHCIRNEWSIPSGYRLETCYGVHAEVVAISNALKHKFIAGGTMYCTVYPCVNCAKVIASMGIRKLVYGSKEPLDTHVFTEKIFDEYGVECIKKEEMDEAN